jgi:hypothetical protein
MPEVAAKQQRKKRDYKAERERRKAQVNGDAKPKASKASGAPPPTRGKEIDVSKLDREKTAKRLETIYRLEKAVEKKKASFDAASQVRRRTKADFEKAQDALEKEIRDQRFGPGPLFNPEGTGPAGT